MATTANGAGDFNMDDVAASEELTARASELSEAGARPGQENAGPADAGEPGERTGTTFISRRTVGMALAGVAAGVVVGAAKVTDRGTRPASASASAGDTVHAELTADETAALPSTGGPTYRLFRTKKGPAIATPTGKAGLVTGLVFEVTTGGCWLEGYWLWVCEKGQSTKPQEFALWIPYPTMDAPKGVLIPSGTVTSKKLVPGKWNYIPLPAPLPLPISTYFVLETAAVGGVPVTGGVWNPAKPGAVDGPLLAPSSGPNGIGQSPVTVGSNPTKVMPIYGGYPANAYYWLSPQISTTPPAGASFRLWPTMPLVVATPKSAPDTTEQSSGTEFWLSNVYSDYKLDKIWFWSPIANVAAGLPKAALLPSSCAIFDIATKAVVPGTLRGTAGPDPKVMPDWRRPDGKPAAPGDGWVYCAYEGIRLPPGEYKTAVYCYAGGNVQDIKYLFFEEQRYYFGAAPTAPASAPKGILNGPLYSPSIARAALANSNGTVPGFPPGRLVHGNSTYQDNNGPNRGMFLYPDTFDNSDNGEVRWIDVEVTPGPKAKPKSSES
jgi:hypothetical protein